jgi:nuclear pore complex protein Nup160
VENIDLSSLHPYVTMHVKGYMHRNGTTGAIGQCCARADRISAKRVPQPPRISSNPSSPCLRNETSRSKMAAHDLRFSYKETRLALDLSSVSSVVHVQLPGQSTSGRAGSRRTNGTEGSVLEEEKAFRVKKLATASNLYHRVHHSSPRSFLWRVLDDGHVLSLQAFDLTRDEKEAEAPHILQIHFATPIRPSCVALSDPKDHDALNVFVLDQESLLYSLTLRSDAFRKRSAADLGSGNDCSTYASSVFTFKYAHRLVAIDSDQVLVTLHDGGLLKLERNKAHNAQTTAAWKETSYNAQHWTSGFRRILPFQGGPTVKYGSINMELSAATSIAVRRIQKGSDALLFSVCLDHHMRIWNVGTGQILYSADLLKTNRKLEDIGKWTVDPALGNLIRLVNVSETKSLVVTYSPVGTGQFKLWRVDTGDDKTVFVHDYFPASKIVPPSPSHSDAWTLADFGIVPGGNGRGELWVLWKNNVTYRVQRTEYCTREDAIQSPWENGSDSVYVGLQTPTARSSNPSEPTDPSEKWLKLIFASGNFSVSTLETALAMYERGLGSSRESTVKRSRGLAESICAVLGSATTLSRTAEDNMDYEQFRATSEIHWRRFYRLLMELDKQRGEALALVLDTATGLFAVVCADLVAVVRKTSDLDRICHNLAAPAVKDEAVFRLVSAGLAFVESFSDSMWQVCNAALQSDLFEDSSKTDEERIQAFSDRAGFWRQVSEEDCALVVDALGDKFMTVTPAVYQDLFAAIGAREDAMSQEARQPFTELGRRLVVRGVQDTADLHWQILFSQLVLLVHMEFEFDEESDALHSRFDIGLVYRQLLGALKRLEHIKWLGQTELTLPGAKADRPNPANDSPASARRAAGEEPPRSTTAFEAIVGHLFGMTDAERRALYSGVTDAIVNMCAPDSDTELLPAVHQCWLLKQDRPDLALALGPFCDQDPFSTYVQGRTFLALREFDTAAQYFRRAAYNLSECALS